MRALWPVALFVGCGSPAPIDLPSATPTREQVAEGGESRTDTPPPTESFRTCTVLRLSSGGNPLGWGRMVFDAAGRPRFKAAGSDSAPTTQSEYGYDSVGRLVSDPPATFAYEGANLMLGGSLYATLDAHDRVITRWAPAPPGSGELLTASDSYTYDDAGRVLQHDSAYSNRRYEYDSLGFLTSETLLQPDGPGTCRRAWVWSHGPTEEVAVHDDAGNVTQRCRYVFDDLDRLTSAKCTHSGATWQYEGDTITMSFENGGAVIAVARFVGECSLGFNRSELARSMPIEHPDPRGDHVSLDRIFLRMDLRPMPALECVNGPGFD